jgi:uncharacterized OB-fold protein
MGHMLGRFGDLAEMSVRDTPKKPLPRLTPDNHQYWEGCRERKVMLPWCTHCDRPHWPPGPVCPYCFGEELTWKQASGRGTISSWVVVYKAWLPAFEADIPYNAVQVELEEGVRLTGNVVEARNDELRVGLPVEVVFDDVTPEFTLSRFKLR